VTLTTIRRRSTPFSCYLLANLDAEKEGGRPEVEQRLNRLANQVTY
jgi:hypothetical protein